jgi:outer membrane biosynthesis protein TonB
MKQLTILALLVSALGLTSCRTMHSAAVSTFRVVDAPHQYVRRQLGMDEPQPQTTTTTTTSATYPNTAYPPPQTTTAAVQPQYQPQAQRQPPPPPRPPPPVQTQTRVVTREQTEQPTPPPRPTATPVVITRENTAPTTTTTQVTEASQGSELPYAKPVPGKPGYVFSPFDKNGGYVDVTGYSPGQKVKDPYSGRIFLVP